MLGAAKAGLLDRYCLDAELQRHMESARMFLRKIALALLLMLWPLIAHAAPFPYTPGPDTPCTNNWHGNNTVCLDVVVLNDGVSTRVIYAVFQKQPSGLWDWLGNAPINVNGSPVQPDGSWGFKSEFWGMDIAGNQVVYKDPYGVVHQDYPLNFMNQYQGHLVTDWITNGNVNAFLDALWAAVSGGASGPPFTDTLTGAAWLGTQLAAFQWDASGHVSPK